MIPPQISTDMVMEARPEIVLDVRYKDEQGSSGMEVLLKWQDLPMWEATWEDF